MSTTTTTPVRRALDVIAQLIAAERDRGGLDDHDRAILERSLGTLRDQRPDLELIVSAYLAAGPTGRLVIQAGDGGHEVSIVMRDEGAERIASRQAVDAATAEALRPLSV